MARKTRRAAIDIVKAIRDKRLIGDKVSPAQETALRALYGLPLVEDQAEIYQRATDRSDYQPREYREATFICGRRSGKSSKLAANIAVFEAAFRKHNLARGERGHVVVIAITRKQAQVAFRYILSRLESSPTLRAMIAGDPRAEEIDLKNGITISVWPCSFRSIRGLSIVCAIADELAFWRDDTSNANPADEVLRAIRPAMATFDTAKLVKITSPYAKSGPVWDDYRMRLEQPDRLVWRLDTATMNPALSRKFLAEEEARDPEYYAREYLAEFWESASALLSSDAIESCVVRDRQQLPPVPEKYYVASLDAAFRGDNFAFSIVHGEDKGKVVQDVIRSWRGSRSKPVDLTGTLGEIIATLRSYGIGKIHGDSFCSEPIRQALAAQGIQFEQANTLGARAAGLWQTLRTLITGGNIELLDDPEQTAELKRLETVVTSGGNQRVEATSGHDDRAVALGLAAHQAVSSPGIEPWVEIISLRERVTDDSDWGWTRI